MGAVGCCSCRSSVHMWTNVMTEELLQHHCANFPDSAPRNELPSSSSLRAAIGQALQQGCAKFTNVFLHGPNTSGKSHVLKPLAEIYQGSALLRPMGRGNYPMQNIVGKKVCILQEVRVNTFKFSFDSLLVWWEGESFPVPHAKEHSQGR